MKPETVKRLKDYVSVANFIRSGGTFEMAQDRRVLLERGVNDLTEGTLESWDIEYDLQDPNNFGYFLTSKVDINLTGPLSGQKKTNYPMSMCYIEVGPEDTFIKKRQQPTVTLLYHFFSSEGESRTETFTDFREEWCDKQASRLCFELEKRSDSGVLWHYKRQVSRG